MDKNEIKAWLKEALAAVALALMCFGMIWFWAIVERTMQ